LLNLIDFCRILIRIICLVQNPHRWHSPGTFFSGPRRQLSHKMTLVTPRPPI
jgi:hypothetical protein